MNSATHTLADNGICWITRTVRGELAWILCGRASYEALTRCDEHSPLIVAPDANDADGAKREE